MRDEGLGAGTARCVWHFCEIKLGEAVKRPSNPACGCSYFYGHHSSRRVRCQALFVRCPRVC